MPVTYGDIVRADLMSIDRTERSPCCGHVINIKNREKSIVQIVLRI